MNLSRNPGKRSLARTKPPCGIVCNGKNCIIFLENLFLIVIEGFIPAELFP